MTEVKRNYLIILQDQKQLPNRVLNDVLIFQNL